MKQTVMLKTVIIKIDEEDIFYSIKNSWYKAKEQINPDYAIDSVFVQFTNEDGIIFTTTVDNDELDNSKIFTATKAFISYDGTKELRAVFHIKLKNYEPSTI